MDGCRYGLKDGKGENLVRKAWRIKTTDSAFQQEFEYKTCTNKCRDCFGVGDHPHTVLEGQEVARTAYYPDAMSTAIAVFWQKQLLRSTEELVHNLMTLIHSDAADEHGAFALESLPKENPRRRISTRPRRCC